MNNQLIEFCYSGVTIAIHCSEKEIMKDVIQRFCNKAKVDKSKIYCLYSGMLLDENAVVKNLIKSKNKDDKIVILVYPIDNRYTQIKEEKVKQSNIICPQCQDIATIKIQNYKISINCRNNHKTDNMFLKDFETSQKIDESKIVCEKCKQKNKSNSYNKEFFICLQCNISLCPLCKSTHNSNHSIIKYDQKPYICFEHEDTFSSYCKLCKVNLCTACENKHSGHDIISLGKLFPDKKELNQKIEDFKVNFGKLKKDVNNLIEILNTFLKNIEIFYNMNKNINNSFTNKLKNYEYLNSIQEINNNGILNDIIKIVNENNKYYKFKQILYIYNNMVLKEINNISGINNINNNIVNNNFSGINNINNNMENNNNNNNFINNNFNSSMMNFNINNANNNFHNNNLNPKTFDINVTPNNFGKLTNNNLNSNGMNNFNSGSALGNFNMNNMNQNITNNHLNNPNTNFANNNFNMNNNNFNQNLMNNFNNNGFGFPGFNMMINNFGIRDDEDNDEWMKAFKMGIEEVNKVNSKSEVYNVTFKTNRGKTTNIKVGRGTTLSHLIEMYFERINRISLMGNNNIVFISNGMKISHKNNNIPVEDFFKNTFSPYILVCDNSDLIGK